MTTPTPCEPMGRPCRTEMNSVSVCRALQQFRSDGFDVIFEILAGDAAQGHNAVFSALAAVDAQQFFLKVHVVHGQVAQLGLADAGGVKHFEQRPVAVARPACACPALR